MHAVIIGVLNKVPMAGLVPAIYEATAADVICCSSSDE
jgi:hypothetical protein